MKRSRYLNVVLTMIAVLLAALVWISVADRPLLSSSASATPPGLPDAGSQRREIQRAVEDVETDIEKLYKLLSSGKLRVEVANFDELKQETRSNGAN